MKRLFCVAPMMKKTDKHFRFLCRNLSKNSYLYTEMIHCNAILRGDSDKLLSYDQCEHPIALQLGGSNPNNLTSSSSNKNNDFDQSNQQSNSDLDDEIPF